MSTYVQFLFDEQPNFPVSAKENAILEQRTFQRQAPKFSGPAYDSAKDEKRLTGQIQRIYVLMSDKRFRTLGEIHKEILASTGKHDTEASISAQLRHLRKPAFGSHTINRQRREKDQFGNVIESCVHEYQLIPNKQ